MAALDSPPLSPKYSTFHARMATQIQNLQRQMEQMSANYDRQLAILQNREDRNEGVKIKLPTFQGRNDPEAYLKWEMKIEQFFQSNSYNERKKVKVASLQFKDYALIWWNQLQKERKRFDVKPIETWAEMKKIMRRRHAPYHYHEVLLNKSKKEGNTSTSTVSSASSYTKKPMEAFPNVREKRERDRKESESENKIEKKSDEKERESEKKIEENSEKNSEEKESVLSIKSEERKESIARQPRCIFSCKIFYVVANASNNFSLFSGVAVLLQIIGDFIQKEASYGLTMAPTQVQHPLEIHFDLKFNATNVKVSNTLVSPQISNSRSNSLKEGGDDMSQGGATQLVNKDNVSPVRIMVQVALKGLGRPKT